MAFDTNQPAQISGLNGYTVNPIVTIGDTIGDYTPPGIPDGVGAYELDDNTVRILVNHELGATSGYAYSLANGTELAGARVSYFDIDKSSRTVVAAGPAYDTIINRQGEGVDEASDLEFGGIQRLCSAQYVPAHQFGEGMGLVDGLFFTGEETAGGTEYVVDPATQTLYAVPWMGRAAWESVTELNTGSSDTVALLAGDDRAGAPLLLYIGEKNAQGDGSLLDRNGLAQGKLYVWVSANGDLDPSQFNGTGQNRDGRFVEIDFYRPDLASADGSSGYDAQGFATQAQQDVLSAAVGAFKFSRPEDVSTNPTNGTQAALNSTGRGQLFGGADTWGTTYRIDVDFSDLSNIGANIDVLYDADDAGAGQFAGPDYGLRSADNMDWADDGYLYLQEDRSTSPETLFGETSGEEASIWRLDPSTGKLTRIAQMNRDTGVPTGQTDGAIGEIGNWESSGILDVSILFDAAPGSLLIATTQAHSLVDGAIADQGLVEGGQIYFLSGPATLEGYASLPADTFAEGPPTGEGISGNGRTGPFEGPPVQGFSGVQFAPGGDGSNYWFLSDNGFGAQTNSADYLLRLYQADPNFAGSENGDGSVEIQGFVQLSDPNNLVPFDIQNGATAERNLTGADFDIESFVIDGKGDIWVGEEFGPYVLHFDSTGKLLEAPIPTPNLANLNTLNGQAPVVIGHRGASGSRPEHTLASYELAIELGADFIEPDLVVTKDGVLVARHENEISGTTDVADHPEFADRQTTKVVDGTSLTGWFVEDFTLAELKTLRAKERIPGTRPDNTQYDGQFEIPTLTEVIDLVKSVEAATGKTIGIYPETKHPTFLAKEGAYLDGTPINQDTSQLLVDTLIAEGFTDPSRIFIQSFEVQNLIEIQTRLDAEGLGDIPLVQLYGDTTTAADPTDPFSFPYDIRYNVAQGNDLVAIYGQDFLDAAENPLSADTVYGDLDNATILQVISDQYAEGAGPWKNNFLLRESIDPKVDGNGDGKAEIGSQLTGEVTSFVEDAHAAGLQVHPYTLRAEEGFLTLNAEGTPQTLADEIVQLTQIGVDGFFTDFPGIGDEVRDRLVDDFVRAPQNPTVQSGEAVSNLGGSKGYEGMAFSPDRQTLYPLLEGTVFGDPAGSLRIYEFDTTTSVFEALVGLYQMDAPDHAIGDFTPVNDHEFLIIERDGGQGETAEFKKIFKIDISAVNDSGFVKKEELVDLLNISDPSDLNGDGSTTYAMPFVTIENVLVLDEDTILVANDNNYPFSVGRPPAIDNNEIVQIKLNQPLDLDPRLGVAGLNNVGTAGQPFDTSAPAQMQGLNGYTVDPLFTVGETYGGFTPTGIFDGLGAFALDDDTVRVYANSELGASTGYAYELASGAALTGGRVSYFDIDKDSLAIVDAGLAYDTIINRAGEVVDEASDLEFEGIDRLCSAQYIEAYQFGNGIGLEDALFFTGEETDGGTEFVLDPDTNTLYAVPWMGRAAWESVTELNTGTTDKVALLIGDDRGGAPLLLYIGEKQAGGNLLERNGLAAGRLYVWAADSGELSPEEFNGTGEDRNGTWNAIDYYRPDLAGNGQYDALGFATQEHQDALAEAAGAFKFSRPEDVATNPEDGTQAVLASTGRDSLFPSDAWGTTYLIDTEFGADGTPVAANVKAIYDGDDAGAGQFAGPDYGLRSPDNLDWADNGLIYIQEDRSIDSFGEVSGEEASIWTLDPATGKLTRVAQMDRSAVPAGQSDPSPTDIGNWESSGIIDVSGLFDKAPGSLFLFGTQAHSLRDGVIASENLVQGGQLSFLVAPTSSDSSGGGGSQNLIKPLVLSGTVASETLFGGEGNDILYGNGGGDRLIGNGGDDILYGEPGADTLIGGAGNDILYGNGGEDRLIGDGGNDILYGEASSEIIIGGTGNDTIYGNGGGDYIDPGTGLDWVWVGQAGGATVVLHEGEGYVTVVGFKAGTTQFALGSSQLQPSDLTFGQEGSHARILHGSDLLAVVEWTSPQTVSSAFA